MSLNWLKRALMAAVAASAMSILSLPELKADDNASSSGGKVIKIPLKVTSIPDPKATDTASKVKLAILKEFRKKYPNIELQQFSGISIPGIGMESKLMLAIAGGSAPDIIYVNFRVSDTYIQQKFLYPLDEFIENDKAYKSVKSYISSLPGPIRPVIYREGPKVGNIPAGEHVWAISSSILVRALFWRKDLFQEVGLDPEKPPKTWDELYEYAKRLSDPSKRKYGLSMSSGEQASWDFMAFLWSAGGDAVEKNKNGEWVASFGSKEAAVALDFYLRLAMEKWEDPDKVVQTGYTTRTAMSSGSNIGDPWSEGRLGMTSQYLSDKMIGGETDPALIGIAPFPSGPTGKAGTEVNSGMEGIFAGIEGRKNSDGIYVPAEKIREAAWQYLSFMNSKEARGINAKLLVDLGMGRYMSPSWLREFGYTEYLKYFPPTWEKAFNDAMADGKPEPYGRNCQMVYLYLTKPIDEAMQLARQGDLLDKPREERLEILQAILKRAADNTNIHMIGKISPEEKAKRNRYAIIVSIIILAIFSFTLYRIWQVFSPKDTFTGARRGWAFRKNWLGYTIMIPALLSILIWIYYPMVSGSQILFQEYRVVGGSEWIGFENLANVLFSNEWWNAVWNTFRYMVIILGLGFIAPIILAVLLQEVSCGKIIYRTLYYLPAVMSGLVVIYMWKLFYQSGPSGIMNQVIASVYDCINFILVPLGSFFSHGYAGIKFEPIAWLEDSKWALFACIIPSIWAGAGPGCLIYLAALKGVPEDIYEAAEIDGANFFQKIWHVTIPSIKSLIVINFVGAFIGAAQSGGMILIMTFGAANTEVAELHIFKEAYTNLKFGGAIAMAWILGVMTLMFTLYQLKKLSNMEFKTTGK